MRLHPTSVSSPATSSLSHRLQVVHRTPDDSARFPSVHAAVEALRRRKWIALFAFASALAAAISVVRSLPDLYHATATLLVDSQQVSEAFVRPTVTAELETRIQTIRQEVLSRARLTALIADLDLYPDLRAKGWPEDAIVERMRRTIELEPSRVEESGRGPTIAFLVGYSGRDPQTVAQVANRLASFFVEENTRMRSGQASRTAEFLKSQLADVRKELAAQEHRTSTFTLSHIGELPEQVEVNLVSLERLNTQLRLNSEHQIRSAERRERLEQQLDAAESAAPLPEPSESPRALELAKLRQQLSDLLRKYTDEYPEVIRVRQEIASRERESRTDAAPVSAPTAVPDPKPRLREAIAEAVAELTALRQEELTLRQGIASYEQRVENVPKRQEEFQSLSRDYQTIKDRYDTLLKRYEEAQLAESLEQGHAVGRFRILDPAIPPREPSAPSRTRLLIVGILFSLAMVAAVVLAAEYFDTSFHDVDDLRAAVAVPAIFSVPLIAVRPTGRTRVRTVALAAVSVVALLLIVAGSHYIATGNEQLVRLVARGRM